MQPRGCSREKSHRRKGVTEVIPARRSLLLVRSEESVGSGEFLRKLRGQLQIGADKRGDRAMPLVQDGHCVGCPGGLCRLWPGCPCVPGVAATSAAAAGGAHVELSPAGGDYDAAQREEE